MEKPEYDALVKKLYFPSAKQPEIITIPTLRYAMADGHGDPNTSPQFQDALGALYAISYGIRMLPKKGIVPDGYFEYKVNALEGLWDISVGESFDPARKDNLVWTLMIMQPPFVTPELFDYIRENAKKKNTGNPALGNVRFEAFDEGLCCQMTHIGPFDTELATFERMARFTQQRGCRRTHMGHHEIYMNDFRKTAPEKLKTVLRFRLVKE